jgi:hypothetical protein
MRHARALTLARRRQSSLLQLVQAQENSQTTNSRRLLVYATASARSARSNARAGPEQANNGRKRAQISLARQHPTEFHTTAQVSATNTHKLATSVCQKAFKLKTFSTFYFKIDFHWIRIATKCGAKS